MAITSVDLAHLVVEGILAHEVQSMQILAMHAKRKQICEDDLRVLKTVTLHRYDTQLKMTTIEGKGHQKGLTERTKARIPTNKINKVISQAGCKINGAAFANIPWKFC